MAHKYLACSGPAGAATLEPEHLWTARASQTSAVYAGVMAMDTTRFLDEARRLTEQRMAAAETIAAALTRRDDAHAAAAAADAEAEAAFRDAERAGWTAAELNRLRPADLGSRKRATRPRKSRRSAPDTNTAPRDPAQVADTTQTTD